MCKAPAPCGLSGVFSAPARASHSPGFILHHLSRSITRRSEGHFLPLQLRQSLTCSVTHRTPKGFSSLLLSWAPPSCSVQGEGALLEARDGPVGSLKLPPLSP